MSKSPHNPKAAVKGHSVVNAAKGGVSPRRNATFHSQEVRPRNRRNRHSSVLYWIGGLVAVLVMVLVSLSGGGTSQGSSGVNIQTLPVGSVAPTFSGRDALTGRPIGASTLEGENVLYFFNSGSTCQACMVQAEDLQRYAESFRRAHIALVIITNDDTTSLIAAARADGLTLPMVADPKGILTTRFGAVGGGMNMGASAADHSFILVDKLGRVRFHRDYPNMWIPASELLKLLPKLA